MNKRQKKKEFKKIVGFNPDKNMNNITRNYLVWALHPGRMLSARYQALHYIAGRQQVKNIENFNKIMTKRRMG